MGLSDCGLGTRETESGIVANQWSLCGNYDGSTAKTKGFATRRGAAPPAGYTSATAVPSNARGTCR